MIDIGHYTQNKGVSVVIGAILMFGIAIIALSIHQATVVPHQNQNVEFQHYTELRSDMINYNTTIDQTKTSGSASTTLTLSKAYPSRVAAVNPPPFTTKLTIQEPQNITISNFEVDGPTNENLYWDQRGDYSIINSIVKVEPDYYYWQDSGSYWYENQIIYSEEPGGSRPVISDETNPVRDNSITVHGYTGEYSGATTGSKRIKVSQISGSEKSLYITGSNNQPIELQFNTRLSESLWREILDSSTNDNIESISYEDEDNRVTIELDPQQTYSLDGYLSATNPNDEVTATANPEYLVNNGGDTVSSGQNIFLSVHDELGNTVSDASVIVDENPNNCIEVTEKRTNSLGQVIFNCETNQNERQISFYINDGSEDYETVTVTVRQSTGGGGGGGWTPPGQDN